MLIRPFRPHDFPEVMKIEKESFPADAYDEEFFTYLSQKGGFLVAVEKQVVGYVLYSWKGEIFSIAVDRKSRCKSIGSSLLKRVLEDLKGRTDKVWVHTRVSNKVAQEFFKKHGFELVGREPDYYKDEDALVMVKVISRV